MGLPMGQNGITYGAKWECYPVMPQPWVLYLTTPANESKLNCVILTFIVSKTNQT